MLESDDGQLYCQVAIDAIFIFSLHWFDPNCHHYFRMEIVKLKEGFFNRTGNDKIPKHF
jgi:hypothetical protein